MQQRAVLASRALCTNTHTNTRTLTNKRTSTPSTYSEQRVFILDTRTGKIVAPARLPDPARVSALAWAPTRGACYEFATASQHRVHVWTVDPFKGFVSCERVTTGTVRK